MNANSNVSIATVNFPKEIVGKHFGGLAVVKTAPETGVLVCLNSRNGCSLSIMVDVPVCVGGVFLRREELYSLGCWGDLDVGCPHLSSLNLEDDGAELSDDAVNGLLTRPREGAVCEACERLGVSTLIMGEDARCEIKALATVRVPRSTRIVVE